MKIQSVRIATVLAALIALVATSPAPAHEQSRQEVIVACTSAPIVSRSVRGPLPLDRAIHFLLCLEAREATLAGRHSADTLEWILVNAHSCEDQRLLVDTFGL